ncbi:molecular chaperone GrpE [Allocatelliglobosispora scoriae]|uniref:Molecular chaperone GrpE n=1 Tax=Allocatelliglobosispora scoriae TaxID=643052 RepID=A0A841C1X1_9ACTN|nr:nucleotide exchange factor GrpE [Allocatelliglobosispora scoriae]MBB5872970.1 molecular chaperone GrpE [Allocatelliglobosispora scoriae]
MSELTTDPAPSRTDEGAVPGPPGPDVAELLVEIRTQLARDNDRAAARERVIDRLHDENQLLRGGEHRQLLRPVLTDLQHLRNDLIRQAASLPLELTAADAANLLASFADSVELILERAGVQILPVEAGDRFDPSRHRAAGIVPATTAEEDGTVAEKLADGYFDLTVQRPAAPAVVRVRRWTPPAATGEPNTQENS